MSDQLAMEMYNADVSSFYTDVICLEADYVYRFFLSLRMDENTACKFILETFDLVSKDLSHLRNRNPEEIRVMLLSTSWELFLKKDHEAQKSTEEIDGLLQKIDLRSRAVLVLTDGLGFSVANISEILNLSESEINSALVFGRKKICEKSLGLEISDDADFIFIKISDYLDGDMPEAEQNTFEKQLKEKFPNLSNEFSEIKGYLQVLFQKYSVSEAILEKIRNFCLNEDKRREFESKEIDLAQKSEQRGWIFRTSIITSLFVGLCYFAFITMNPSKKTNFDPLTALVYEAVTMEEDGGGRLDFPSSSLEEINEFLGDTKGLLFNIPLIKRVPEGWQLEGATIIDYETDKIATLQFNRAEMGKMFLFIFKGAITELPDSTEGFLGKMVYQTYGTEDINVIAWQIDPELLGMLVGHDDALSLAKSAQNALE